MVAAVVVGLTLRMVVLVRSTLARVVLTDKMGAKTAVAVVGVRERRLGRRRVEGGVVGLALPACTTAPLMPQRDPGVVLSLCGAVNDEGDRNGSGKSDGE
jgi:hypothetical protein